MFKQSASTGNGAGKFPVAADVAAEALSDRKRKARDAVKKLTCAEDPDAKPEAVARIAAEKRDSGQSHARPRRTS